MRAYPWGTCQTLAEPHSDLPLLKRLLLDEGAAELKAATEARYYAAREAALASRCEVSAKQATCVRQGAATCPTLARCRDLAGFHARSTHEAWRLSHWLAANLLRWYAVHMMPRVSCCLQRRGSGIGAPLPAQRPAVGRTNQGRLDAGPGSGSRRPRRRRRLHAGVAPAAGRPARCRASCSRDTAAGGACGSCGNRQHSGRPTGKPSLDGADCSAHRSTGGTLSAHSSSKNAVCNPRAHSSCLRSGAHGGVRRTRRRCRSHSARRPPSSGTHPGPTDTADAIWLTRRHPSDVGRVVCRCCSVVDSRGHQRRQPCRHHPGAKAPASMMPAIACHAGTGPHNQVQRCSPL